MTVETRFDVLASMLRTATEGGKLTWERTSAETTFKAKLYSHWLILSSAVKNERIPIPSSLRVYDVNGEMIGEYFNENLRELWDEVEKSQTREVRDLLVEKLMQNLADMGV